MIYLSHHTGDHRQALPRSMRALGLIGLMLGLLLAIVAPAAAQTPDCAAQDRLQVPGAERQRVACLGDLTTAGLPQNPAAGDVYTLAAQWTGLHAAGTSNPSGVPGVQIDGYFPDTSTFNTTHGWNHDSQFVIRLPNNWNGKLMITGAPGVRGQYANDYIISDWVLAKGYAFASTDKGNTGATFFLDGDSPGDAIAEWHQRVEELTIAAKQVVRQHYRRPPQQTYIAGLSNGGYLVRYALENNQQHYDGGVDWAGTLFRAEGPNLLTYLPTALKYYPIWADQTRSAAEREAAHDAMIAAGFEPGTEFLWPLHYAIYWDFTQRTYREEFDPAYDGDLLAGVPFCAPGTPNCDADYDYFSRPQAVKDAVASVSLTGKIKRPLISLHGNLDTLLPIKLHGDAYADLIIDSQRERLHRYYVVEDGTHVDSFYPFFPGQLRPILPCFRAAFESLERWVENKPAHRNEPPASGLIPRPASGDLLGSCALNTVSR